MNRIGIGGIIGCSNDIENPRENLKISRPIGRIKSLLKISELKKIFDDYDSVEEALASFGEEGKQNV